MADVIEIYPYGDEWRWQRLSGGAVVAEGSEGHVSVDHATEEAQRFNLNKAAATFIVQAEPSTAKPAARKRAPKAVE